MSTYTATCAWCGKSYQRFGLGAGTDSSKGYCSNKCRDEANGSKNKGGGGGDGSDGILKTAAKGAVKEIFREKSDEERIAEKQIEMEKIKADAEYEKRQHELTLRKLDEKKEKIEKLKAENKKFMALVAEHPKMINLLSFLVLPLVFGAIGAAIFGNGIARVIFLFIPIVAYLALYLMDYTKKAQ